MGKAAGLENPTPAELARLDRKRKKKGSNEEWKSPSDPDARIAKMKDGRTHLAYAAEHAVDLEHGTILALTIQAADLGDTATFPQTLGQAQRAVKVLTGQGIAQAVLDKGYHRNAVLVHLHDKESPSPNVAGGGGRVRRTSRG